MRRQMRVGTTNGFRYRRRCIWQYKQSTHRPRVVKSSACIPRTTRASRPWRIDERALWALCDRLPRMRYPRHTNEATQRPRANAFARVCSPPLEISVALCLSNATLNLNLRRDSDVSIV